MRVYNHIAPVYPLPVSHVMMSHTSTLYESDKVGHCDSLKTCKMRHDLAHIFLCVTYKHTKKVSNQLLLNEHYDLSFYQMSLYFFKTQGTYRGVILVFTSFITF